MGLIEYLVSPYALLALPLLYYILPYLRNWNIRGVPAPFPAAFTNLWLMYACPVYLLGLGKLTTSRYQARMGKRYLAVDAAHKKYGKLVRIQPHHVSVADPEAIPLIYGHGSGFLKRYVVAGGQLQLQH